MNIRYTEIALPCRIDTQILALGAQSKSAFCFAKRNTAYLSDYGGDLSDLKNFKIFEKQIKTLQKKLKIEPEIIACDLHPEYISSKYAYDWVKGEGWRVKKIQHHGAHVASCMADNNVKGKIIGIAFDGTGFGLDGNIWGGEFFISDIKGFKRVAYLKYIQMPGGESAIKEPWRMAFSYLYSVYGQGFKDLDIGFVSKLDKEKAKLLIQMMDKKINSPVTSSIGRLFDAIASLIGICSFTRYEGEPAIRLEKTIKGEGRRVKGEDKYRFKYVDENGIVIIDWSPIIKGIVKDLKKGVSKSEISMKFHNAICGMVRETCNLLKKRYRIFKICLSGGVFQNRYLNSHVRPILEKQGFEVYFHNRIPTHDGGIALGQAILAGV